MAEFLLALADFDRRRGWESLGHTSCFCYLNRELGLSKSAAFYRASAAELLQRYPEIAGPLRDGRLCLSSVAELAKVITPENRAVVVPRFFHVSKGEAKAVAAELNPVEAPPRRVVVTAIAAPAVAAVEPGFAPASVLPDEPLSVKHGAITAPPRPPPSPAVPRNDVEPLNADLRRIHITVTKRFMDKLYAARDALSHSHPGADEEAVLEAALDLLLDKKNRQKSLVKKPRTAPARPSARPRHIPAEVKRAVWIRDGGKCAWPLASGGVCGSTRQLELDHLVPVARGGPSTVENLRVTCRAHNLLHAEQIFGRTHMEPFRR